jgi:hypothetical protein
MFIVGHGRCSADWDAALRLEAIVALEIALLVGHQPSVALILRVIQREKYHANHSGYS